MAYPGWTPGAHLIGQDKDRKITQQFLSQVKQTRLGEINLIHC